MCLMFGGSASVLGLAIATLMVLVHSSFRQRSLKSKVNVGFINMLSGGRQKHEDGPDDADDAADTAAAGDVEDPPRDGSRLPGTEAELSGSRNEQLLKEQQQFRSAFRAQMRAKYLKKG